LSRLNREVPQPRNLANCPYLCNRLLHKLEPAQLLKLVYRAHGTETTWPRDSWPYPSAELLGTLYRYRSAYGTPYQAGEREPGWFRPTDLGGHARSNHSHRLRNLIGKGLVDTKAYTGGSFARIYRISEAGVTAWERYAEHLAQTT
jgi:hypothetical protein